MVGASTFAVIGLSFALWSGSQAVLLDGAYNLISALMVLVAIRITTLLDHPGTPNRPVGYVALEPLYVLTKGLVLLALTLVVMASNLAILLSGGTELDLGAVVIYVALAVTGNLTVWLLIRRERRRASTPLLQVEEQNWMINTLVSGAIAVSFVLVVLLQDGLLEPAVPYIDQIVVITVCVVSLPVPVSAIRSGMRDLLLFGPDQETRRRIDEAIADRMPDEHVERWTTEAFTMGRHLWLSVFLVPTTPTVDSGFSDDLARRLLDELDPELVPVRLDVVLTETTR